jgi:ubiquinone/menaquinone biosynthesis C-methylase UbiE
MYPVRIPEITEDLFSAEEAAEYRTLQESLLKRGLLPLKGVTEAGIDHGTVLEVGPGPGYLGLEWLGSREVRSDSELIAIDVNRNMIAIARAASDNYREKGRYSLIQGDAEEMPFCRNTFDGVFSAYSLHEWKNPVNVISGIQKILKISSSAMIIDLKRNIRPEIILKEKSMMRNQSHKNFESSVRAAYTGHEIDGIMSKAGIHDYQICEDSFNLKISWKKDQKFNPEGWGREGKIVDMRNKK